MADVATLTNIYIGVIGGIIAGLILRTAQLVSDKIKKKTGQRYYIWEFAVILLLFILFSIYIICLTR